jgi:hypothetical protein
MLFPSKHALITIKTIRLNNLIMERSNTINGSSHGNFSSSTELYSCYFKSLLMTLNKKEAEEKFAVASVKTETIKGNKFNAVNARFFSANVLRIQLYNEMKRNAIDISPINQRDVNQYHLIHPISDVTI